MKYFSLLVLLTSFQLLSFAQNTPPCLTDEKTQEYISSHPEMAAEVESNISELITYLQEDHKKQAKATKYVIPVVFHVIHEYGSENISKEQILDQMRVLNEDFSRTNADASNTRAAFVDRAADMEIEFKLATKDPNGNCTDGITRSYSSLTNDGADNVKGVIRWPYRSYLNIWVVKNISRDPGDGGTILGYAYLPYATGESIDGIVIRADRVGTIGTSSKARAGRTLTHEVGHWLGLRHPFQNSCGGGNCSTSGDLICDTPPVSEPSYGCPTNNNSCSNDSPDEIDMIENYMDYANGNCMNAFTNGQRNVCHFYLDRTTYRGQNVSSSNLLATGVDAVSSCAPTADFYVQNDLFSICEGNAIDFEDWSYGGEVTSREWTFEGGTPSTSTFDDPSVVYNTAGTYKVSLKVTGPNGSDELVRESFVTILPASAELKAPVITNFDEGFNAGNIIINNGGDNTFGWREETFSTYSGVGAARCYINSSTGIGNRYSFETPAFDISEMGDRPMLSFRAAYQRREANASELMIISVSDDCGQSWRALFGYNANNGLASKEGTGTNFAPESNADWTTLNVSLGTFKGSTSIRLRFEVNSISGNSVYLDDIKVGRWVLSSETIDKVEGLKVYPNPSAGSVEVAFQAFKNNPYSIEVYDIQGRMIERKEGNSTTLQTISEIIDIDAAGVYQFKISSGQQVSYQKVIIH
jgi:PKD repeat protein